MPAQPSQPTTAKPKRSRWLKGCLIVLLAPPLLLGILYAYLLSIPTGYDEEQARASRAARDKILANRLVPREETNPVQALETASPWQTDASHAPTTTSLDISISPEEARFWGKVKWRLKRRSEQFLSYDSRGSRSLPPDELSFDSEKNRPQLSPKNTQAFEKGRQEWDADMIRGRLRGIEKGTVSGGDDLSLIKEGTETVKQMNRIERFLLDAEGDRENSSENPLRDRNNIGEIVSNPTLTVYRAIRDGDREKAVRLIERFVIESGECIFSDSDSSGVSQQNRIADLERFLSRVASDPLVPEETLEWAAATLASWKLDLQEHVSLRAATVNQEREALVVVLRKTIEEQSQEFEDWIDWFRMPSGPKQVVQNILTPVLYRAIDRKAAAVLRQDGAEYEKAQRILHLSFEAMGLSENTIPCPQGTRVAVSYWELLLKDGLAYTSTGISLEELKRTIPGGKGPFNAYSRDKNPFTAFARGGATAEIEVDRFNRAIAMARLLFASARYRRESGHYPDSVEEMIPRYLDESFRPNSERFWTIARMEPFNTVVLPDPWEEDATSFTQILSQYVQDPQNEGKLPAGIEDLKPYADPAFDLTPFAQQFVQIGEYRVFSLVVLKEKHPSVEIGSRMEMKIWESGGTPTPDSAIQYLRFGFPPWNAEGVLDVSKPLQVQTSPKPNGGEEPTA